MKQYVVDAFADKVFHGNPAAVCLLDARLSDDLMLSIARENNLSETAFCVPAGDAWGLRWFTPGGEIDLCGHATLATAYVLIRFVVPDAERLAFETKSGTLLVTRRGDLLEMDFPAYELQPVPVTPEMTAVLGAKPREAFLGRDLLCVFDDPAVVRSMTPDFRAMTKLDGLLVNVTAPGEPESGFDCVSRSFAPKLAVDEDPVSGSGHCHIVPYWARRLGKDTVTAYQASRRGGTLHCRITGDRIALAGKAVLYSTAELYINPDEPV